MCTKLQLHNKEITYQELRQLTNNGELINDNPEYSEAPNPDKLWLLPKMWDTIRNLFSTMPQYYTREMFDHIINNIKALKELFTKNDCHKIITTDKSKQNKILGPLNNLSMFQLVLVLKALRPDKVIDGIKQLILHSIGEEFIQDLPLNLDLIFKESTSQTPFLFILSQGTDTYQQISSQAEKFGMVSKFNKLSLGQGQLSKAEKAVMEAMAVGEWILLQNCHLAPSFMSVLDRIFNIIRTEKGISTDFRLILTTDPSEQIPLQVIQRSIKIRSEQPSTIQNFLKEAYQLLQYDTQLQDLQQKNKQWQRIYFCLSFFHSIIHERKKFGPIGWNKTYEFTMTDLSISLHQIKKFIDESQSDNIPFDAMSYIIGESNYGGRITDTHDLRLLKVILKQYMNEKIFEPDFKISDQYQVPQAQKKQFWIDHIYTFESYPRDDIVQIFGLDENAQITAQILKTDQFINTILQVLPKNSVTQTQEKKIKTPEAKVKEKCELFLTQLPPDFDEEKVQNEIKISYEESLNTVLIQEIKRYNKLLKLIRSSLYDLNMGIEGVRMITHDLENIFNTIHDNQVPDTWKAKSYESEKPLGSWINDLKNRLKFMQDWIDQKSPPKIFWVGAFFYTQSFFTGVQQNYARKFSLPVDKVKFEYIIIPFYQYEKYKVGEEYPENGCYINGLHIDGAKWNEKDGCLQDPQPGQLYPIMPYVYCKPNNTKWMQIRNHIKGNFLCPVYKTSKRSGHISSTGISTNWLMDIPLPISKNHTQDYWILKGVALLTSLDQ